jgi:nitrite reductase/ring-hydroxylating ferredoxin subunit
MKKISRPELVHPLLGEGLKFSELVLVSEGEYAADDSDWNYKDIPHLHIVHELAESFPAVIGDDIICSINMQKILGFWFPVALVNYEYAKHHQVYYTTLLFFALIIETRSEEYEPLKTRVTTTYSIGSPRWLFWMMPLLKALIRKNYKNLMSTDIPMRERRGQLRKLGYRMHKKGDTYTFSETSNITATNISPPPGNRIVQCAYTSLLNNADDVLVGDAGLLGFRLMRSANDVLILPRTCPHEGASLEKADFSTGAVRCPWHGRRLLPIGKYTWGQDASFSTDTHNVRVNGDILSVEYIGHTTPCCPEKAA